MKMVGDQSLLSTQVSQILRLLIRTVKTNLTASDIRTALNTQNLKYYN